MSNFKGLLLCYVMWNVCDGTIFVVNSFVVSEPYGKHVSCACFGAYTNKSGMNSQKMELLFEIESILYLFCECDISTSIWQHIVDWLNSHGLNQGYITDSHLSLETRDGIWELIE